MRNAFRWKESVGSNEARTGHMNGGWGGLPVLQAGGRQAGWQAGVCARAVQLHASPYPALLCLMLILAPHAPPAASAPPPPAGVWGYWSTDGLGLFEYMLLVEELHTEPIWVVNNGVAHGDSEFVGCVG